MQVLASVALFMVHNNVQQTVHKAVIEMNFEKDINPVSSFRANAAAMLKQVQDSGRPMILTQHGRSAAVLLDIATYQALVDELEELRDIHAGLEDLEAGRVVSHEAARLRLLERYDGQ